MALKHVLGDIPMVRVLDFMLEHLGLDYTTKEISEYADVAPGAVKRDFGRLLECCVVTKTRKIGGVQLYTLNTNDAVTEAFVEFDSALSNYMSEKIAVAEEEPEKYPENQEEEWTTGSSDDTSDLPPG